MLSIGNSKIIVIVAICNHIKKALNNNNIVWYFKFFWFGFGLVIILILSLDSSI